MFVLTLYALFGDDIRLVATDKHTDFYFFTAASLCLAFFFIELFLSSFAKEKYLRIVKLYKFIS